MAALIAALVSAAPAAAAGTGGDSDSQSAGPSLTLPDEGLRTRDVRIEAQRQPAVPVSAAAAKAQAKIRSTLGHQGVLDVGGVRLGRRRRRPEGVHGGEHETEEGEGRPDDEAPSRSVVSRPLGALA